MKLSANLYFLCFFSVARLVGRESESALSLHNEREGQS